MFVLLVVLVLLGSASAHAQPGGEFQEVEEGRPVFVRTEPAAAPYEVRLGPNVSTHLLFDSSVELLSLEGRELFRRVSVAEDAILLLTSREAGVGTRLRMVVRLRDAAPPTDVDFVLAVGPAARAERRVEVHSPQFLESCEEREAVLRCRETLAELRRTCAGASGLPQLTALLSSRDMDAMGVLARPLRNLPLSATPSFKSKEATSFRANRPWMDGTVAKRVRVAVDLWMMSGDPQPWMAHGAELVAADGTRHELTVWQPLPVSAGMDPQRVVLEAELGATEARGTFTLELWDEGRERPVSFGGVSFP